MQKSKKNHLLKLYESSEQKVLFRWLSIKYPEIRKCCFAIPNGGRRDVREAANLKSQGVTAGVPDIFCAIQRKSEGIGGLFIEMKVNKNSLTESQRVFSENVKKEGYAYRVCYSFEEASNAIESYIFSSELFGV